MQVTKGKFLYLPKFLIECLVWTSEQQKSNLSTRGNFPLFLGLGLKIPWGG